MDTVWWLEESGNPILSKDLRAQSSSPEFPAICLDAWQSYSARESSELVLLDGYAFQSTVRFLFAQCASRQQIASYFKRWQELARNNWMLYLVVDDPVAHYELVMQDRGGKWQEQLIAWTENTPLAKVSGLQGQSGFVEFWAGYQSLCMELLKTASIKVEQFEARLISDEELEVFAARVFAHA